MFSYSPVDRNAFIRGDSVQLNKMLQGANSRLLVWFNGELIRAAADTLYFLFAELAEVKKYLTEPVYLGRHESQEFFTCQLEEWHSMFDGLELVGLRAASLTTQGYDLGLLYFAQGMLNWHASHSFCSRCGSATKMLHSGHERKCINPQCGRSHYPKIDPAVIFSVVNNTGPEPRILLARQSHWHKNQHSVLAGFVEPGETLEDAVQREAYEETGIVVKNISYQGSQPWPFPGQIMLGFSCETEQWALDLIDHELESANWFSATDIEQKVKSGELLMPFKASISWLLVNQWFTSQKGYGLEKK